MTERSLKFREPITKGARWGLELMWVVLVLALSVRFFFFHPMSIPSGSMEPTYLGDWSRPIVSEGSGEVGGWFLQWYERLVYGNYVVDIQAKEAGELRFLDPAPSRLGGVALRQRFSIGGRVHTVWFPPDHLWERANLEPGQSFTKGDSVIHRVFGSGDRILVNRWIYNFRPPRRGEAVVFDAHAAETNPTGAFYLKRLMGFGGESVRIGDDRRIRIGGQVLESFVPGHTGVGIESERPVAGHFVGYLNNAMSRQFGLPESAPKFPTADHLLRLEPGQVFVVGDNSVNSRDGRTWGGFSREAIVGKPAFVFWPLSERFGSASR